MNKLRKWSSLQMEGTSHQEEKETCMWLEGMVEIITDVLYVPLMTSNLISICQLLTKGYNKKLERIRGRCMMVMED